MAALCPPGPAWPEVVLSGVGTAGTGTVGGGLGGVSAWPTWTMRPEEAPSGWHLGCRDPLGQQRLWCRRGSGLQPTQPSEALADVRLRPRMHAVGGGPWAEAQARDQSGQKRPWRKELRPKTHMAGGCHRMWGFRHRTSAGLPGSEKPGEMLAAFPSNSPIP